jgi:exodeoxyribonuclease-1
VSFVIYDVETTGLNKRFDQILHFGAIRADENLVAQDRVEFRSRLLPNIVPSPQALHITGLSIDEIADAARPSHYQMVCDIKNVLHAWSPAMFLGFNSITFDEEFLRQAFYQCLHPTFLTNTNGNARADVLNLVRAVATLRPGVLSTPQNSAGRPVFKLAELAVANGLATRQAHDAIEDVELTLQLCQRVREGAPDLWSTFLRFASKATVVDFIREEPAFAYFDYFGGTRCIHLMTRIGINPTDANAHYCLDLTADIDELRRLSDLELVARLQSDPHPVRKLKVNGAPLLCPLWELNPEHLNQFEEADLIRLAASIQMDTGFASRLTRAATAGERIFEPSEHVELQIYGKGFPSDQDVELSRQFHLSPWERRTGLAHQFADGRLRRLARRLIYFERPDLLSETERVAIDANVSRRVRGDGTGDHPWMTIPKALAELDLMMVGELAEENQGLLRKYRDRLLALQAQRT